MEEKLREYQSKLTTNNYKLTSQRKLILEILIQKYGEHLSAEDIYNIVKKHNPDIGLATVYRTLELFCELEIVQQLDFDDSCKRYEIETEESHHHHLVCVSCDDVIEFNDQILEDFEENLEEEYNFMTTEHSIKFYGYCEECQ